MAKNIHTCVYCGGVACEWIEGKDMTFEEIRDMVTAERLQVFVNWVILAYMCVKLQMRLYVCQTPCPFWVHFGSILGPFWVHFGSILGPFWVHFGSILGPFWVHFVYCLSGDASFNQHLNKNRYLDKNTLQTRILI